MSNNSENSFGIVKEVEGYSHSEKHTIIYTWKINEVTSFIKSARQIEQNGSLYSPEFSAGAQINDSWYLQLEIKKDNDTSNNKTWISFYLEPNNGDFRVRTKYLLFLLNNKREKFACGLEVYNGLSSQWIDFQFEGSRGCGYSNFAKIDELLERQSELLENDTLTVGIELTVYDDYVGFNHPINSLKDSGRTLADDLNDLFINTKKSDVVIKVGNEKFYAHKAILVARSPVFDAMFSHNMKENKKNEITIPDFNPQVFIKVLEFIYTDKVEELENFAEELLEASDKYQLHTLKEICEDYLAMNLTIENGISVMILADRHNAMWLKEEATTYIIINFANIKKTEDYKALEKSQPYLAIDLLKKFVDRIHIN